MNEPDDLVRMANEHLAFRYRALPEGWRLYWVDTPSEDKGYVVSIGKFVCQGDGEVLELPDIQGEGATIKDAVGEAMREMHQRGLRT